MRGSLLIVAVAGVCAIIVGPARAESPSPKPLGPALGPADLARATVVGHGDRIVAYLRRPGRLVVRDTRRSESRTIAIQPSCRASDASDDEVLLQCGSKSDRSTRILDLRRDRTRTVENAGSLRYVRLGRRWLEGYRCLSDPEGGTQTLCRVVYLSRDSGEVVNGLETNYRLNGRRLRPPILPPRSLTPDSDGVLAYTPPIAAVRDFSANEELLLLQPGKKPVTLSPPAGGFPGEAGLELTRNFFVWRPSDGLSTRAFAYSIDDRHRFSWKFAEPVRASLTSSEIVFATGDYGSPRRRIFFVSLRDLLEERR